jgi:molybdopterin converting factor small subunit
MAVLRLFAAAREAAGTGREQIDAATVAEVLAIAVGRHGDAFAKLLPSCRVWLNGQEVDAACLVTADDEVAVLPPVSGG